jgi:hypothetical protein
MLNIFESKLNKKKQRNEIYVKKKQNSLKKEEYKHFPTSIRE